MARSPGNWLVGALLVLMIAFLVGNGLIAYRSARTLADYEGQVTHTREVLGELQGVLVALDDAETGQRGYLLLDDPSYLAPYDAALLQLPARLGHLRQLTGDNADQQARLATLADVATRRLELLREVVQLQQAGRDGEALTLVRTGEGRRLMDEARVLIASAIGQEEALLDQRTRAASAARAATARTLILATLGEVLLLVGVAVLLWRNFRQREQVAAERARLLTLEREARAEAEAAVSLRDEFLGIASHELKNPLTALQGSAQILARRLGRRADLDERERRMLLLVGAQATRMRRLIDTMLDVSRIDAGRLTIARERVDLGTLVGRVVEEVAVPQEPDRLVFDGPAEPVIVVGDDLRLEQVVQNLLQNALRYSPADTQVRVQVAREIGRARITVTDRGEGIAAEALPHLFERYYRVRQREGGRGGMGVGLFVVREIIALHDGEVTVASTQGEGSTFTVWLALAPPQDGSPEAPAGEAVDPSPALAV